MKQFFTLISNLLMFLAFDLAHRRPKPLKIMVFFRHFDYFWEELSKLTIQNEGQNCCTPLWLQRKTSKKVINVFFFTVLSQNNNLPRYFVFNNPQALILNLLSPKNSFTFAIWRRRCLRKTVTDRILKFARASSLLNQIRKNVNISCKNGLVICFLFQMI